LFTDFLADEINVAKEVLGALESSPKEFVALTELGIEGVWIQYNEALTGLSQLIEYISLPDHSTTLIICRSNSGPQKISLTREEI
jgi:hypothetical protein